MIDYVDKILAAEESQTDPDDNGFKTIVHKQKTKSSAAPENLFIVNDDCKKLDLVKAKAFHNIMAKALYITK